MARGFDDGLLALDATLVQNWLHAVLLLLPVLRGLVNVHAGRGVLLHCYTASNRALELVPPRRVVCMLVNGCRLCLCCCCSDDCPCVRRRPVGKVRFLVNSAELTVE